MALDITRLSGGNTPADGSDPRTFPAIWNATATALEADVIPNTITTPTAGDLLQYDGSEWVNVGQAEAGAIPVFADSAARSSAIPSPTEGMVTYRSDDDVVEVYNGSQYKSVSSIQEVKFVSKTDSFSASIGVGASSAITGLSITHAVKNSSNKVLLTAHVYGADASGNDLFNLALTAGGTLLNLGDTASNRTRVGGQGKTNTDATVAHSSVSFLYSPGSTSSITYGANLINNENATRTFYVNRSRTDTDAKFFVRTSSTLTLMEVAG